MRGHFPIEPDAIAEALRRHGERVGGVLLAPAYVDTGRVTYGGVHYARADEGVLRPVGETEYARDATFDFSSSRLADWAAERPGADREG